MHDIVDGFEFGWSAGCPRFKLNDGIHDIDENAPVEKRPRVMYCLSKQDAIEKWNRWCDVNTQGRKNDKS
jgi:hypothetical protein